MVRKIDLPARNVQPSTWVRIKSGVCQPRDNLGIACVIENDNAAEATIPRRKKAEFTPQDNLGISCLLKKDYDKLGDIPEMSESGESSEDDSVEQLEEQKVTSSKKADKTNASTVNNAKKNTSNKDNLLKNSTNKNFQKIGNSNPSRLRGGKDTNSPSFSRSKESKEITGRSSKLESTKPRKPILPKDHIGPNCTTLQKSVHRFNTPRINTGYGTKKTSNGKEKKEIVTKFPNVVNKRRVEQC